MLMVQSYISNKPDVVKIKITPAGQHNFGSYGNAAYICTGQRSNGRERRRSLLLLS